jgi:GNAT superfamily N-acetyltransferase
VTIAGERQVEIVRHDKLAPDVLSPLLKMLWSPSAELNAAHLEWKYNRNPYSSTPHVYAAVVEDEVVGMRGFFGCRWEGGSGKPMSAVCTGDLVIVPEHRTRGILTAIMNRALVDLDRMGIPWLLNFSAGATTRLASLAAGWGTTAPIERMRRSNPGSLHGSSMFMPRAGTIAAKVRSQAIDAGHRIERGENAIGSAMRRVTRWDPFATADRSHGGRNSGVEMTSVPRPMAMADLAARCRVSGRISHVRDETYFEWRFQSPLSSYRFFFLGRSTLEAYAVLQARQFPMNGRTVRLAELVGVSAAARKQVLAAAIEACPRVSIDVWTSSLDEDDRAALAAHGFRDQTAKSAAEYTPAVLVRSVATRIPPRPWMFDGQDVLDRGNWNLSLLDSDGC